MKKTLIALAVAGVVAAPAAMAEVTVYGQGHISIGSDNNGSKSWTAVGSNSSRFGIKAAEGLDGGLTAVAQMEFGVDMADSTTSTGASKSNITARNQFVGLAGGFGTILAGRHDAPIKMSTGALDVFADTVADANAVVGAGGATEVRADNAIAYVAPAIGGATIVLAYVPSLVNENFSGPAKVKADAVSAAVMWGQGPLAIDVGYLGGAKDVLDITAVRLGVGYAVSDALKVGFVYDTTTIAATNPDTKFTDYLVNAAFNMGGGNTLKAEFGALNNDTTGAKKANSTLMAIGLDHSFSKNVNGYVVYATVANEDNSTNALGGSGYGNAIAPAAAGKDPNAIEVGMVVKF